MFMDETLKMRGIKHSNVENLLLLALPYQKFLVTHLSLLSVIYSLLTITSLTWSA